jgi:hypothetical protein
MRFVLITQPFTVAPTFSACEPLTLVYDPNSLGAPILTHSFRIKRADAEKYFEPLISKLRGEISGEDSESIGSSELSAFSET